MLTLNERMVSLVSLNSAAIKVIAGENMLEARGEIKVMALINARRAHFLPEEKFCGFFGSSCPSQPTMPRSRSVSGYNSAAGADTSASFSRYGVWFLVLDSSFEVE
jgi:hypothetical protein